jgi:hypothetical protein
MLPEVVRNPTEQNYVPEKNSTSQWRSRELFLCTGHHRLSDLIRPIKGILREHFVSEARDNVDQFLPAIRTL